MKRAPIVTLVAGIVCAAAAVRADLPADRTVDYILRLVPENETSAVVFTVELTVSAVAADGDTVGWAVVGAVFSETDSNGLVLRSWTDESPELGSGDGLWWVSHADGENPTAAEFVALPELAGTAPADDAQEPDLEYNLTTAEAAAPHATMFSGSVAAAGHRFKETGATAALIEGEDEPVEVGGAEKPDA